MNGFVKWMDDSPWWVKLIFAFPVLDFVWAVYRIVKGCANKNVLLIVMGILWILPFGVFTWLIDLVCVIGWKEPKLFV